MKIAIIGAGNMGGSIARGLAKGHSRREALVCGVRHARAEAEEQTDARIRSGRYQF